MALTPAPPRSGKNAISPTSCRFGSRRSASSAAIAAWSARTASSVRSSTIRPIWKPRRKRLKPRPSTRAVFRTSATPCRCTWRIVPAARCAWRSARPRARKRSATRPSTWRSRSRCWTTNAPISASLRACRKWIAAGSIFRPCAACSSCRRCSSSPARVPAAARRPTSSCCRSCSAIGCWSPTPPAAPRSTAATSRRRPGRSTAKGGGRPGLTRCSKITPNSAWASG